jgi:DNA-binding transcriptional LysR family regulator
LTTEEGRSYLAYCQLALQSLDDAHAALQAGRGAVRGKVRISATPDFGRHVLKGWLDEFNLQYPEVTLGLLLADSLSNLLPEEIDLYRFGALVDSSLVGRRLASESTRAVRIADLRVDARRTCAPARPRAVRLHHPGDDSRPFERMAVHAW